MKTLTTVRLCITRTRGCPRSWSDLAPTNDPAVRTCGSCKHDVHYCESDEETVAHAVAGHCIARKEPDSSELPRMFMGRPSVEELRRTPQEEEADAWNKREIGIFYSLQEAGSHAKCESCGYPKVNATRCSVCDTHSEAALLQRLRRPK